jgi:hypothetical protein
MSSRLCVCHRSHWGFQSEYCNPASGNEKGGVEGELGWYRRNWLVPVPEADDLESLNRQLVAASIASRSRTLVLPVTPYRTTVFHVAPTFNSA